MVLIKNYPKIQKKLNKQLKTIKQVGAGTIGTLGAATVVGKVKQNKKDKQRGRK